MSDQGIALQILEREVAICRGDPGVLVVAPKDPELWSLSLTQEETSLVCSVNEAPEGFLVEAGWRALRVQGTLDFSLVGILAGLTEVLAGAEISVFALSTFDTDYLLVRSAEFANAVTALEGAGYSVQEPVQEPVQEA